MRLGACKQAPDIRFYEFRSQTKDLLLGEGQSETQSNANLILALRKECQTSTIFLQISMAL